jgi:hypothetical protein
VKRKIAVTSEVDLAEQLQSRPTRRTVVATGAKLAYAAPIVAASFNVSAINALAAVSPGVTCVHSLVAPGFVGCMPACTSAGLTGDQCNDICGNGQTPGACPVGEGNENPCCNPGYCDPGNYDDATGTYTGPTTGCPASATKKQGKTKRR